MRVRRVLRGALVAACCALAAPGWAGGAAASQKPSEPEVQTHEYVYTHGLDLTHFAVTTKAVLPPFVFTPRRTDNWMHLAADDALGKGVLLHVYQRGNWGERDLKDVYCAPAKIIRLVSHEPVEVHVFSGLCPNHTFGFASTGTLTATFAHRM
jgi:hypothetical protein